MKRLLHRCEVFADISFKNPYGETLFLNACKWASADHLEPSFSWLFDRGACVLDVTPYGATCLHITFMSELRLRDIDALEKEQDSMVWLIRRGAKVRARDNFGQSVSHVVYSTASWHRHSGSFRRDLWDSVLAICGYSVCGIRGYFKRVASYSREYTVEHFRRLWAGREGLCPYPEDLEDAEGDNSFDFGNRDKHPESDRSEEEGSEDDCWYPDCQDHGCRFCRPCGPGDCWSDDCRDPECRFCHPYHPNGSDNTTNQDLEAEYGVFDIAPDTGSFEEIEASQTDTDEPRISLTDGNSLDPSDTSPDPLFDMDNWAPLSGIWAEIDFENPWEDTSII